MNLAVYEYDIFFSIFYTNCCLYNITRNEMAVLEHI